jgi:hypothetical protein
MNPTDFPRGTVGISVANLAMELFKVNNIVASSQHECSQCDFAEEPIDDRLGYVLHADHTIKQSTMNWVDTLSQKTNRRCPDCNSRMKQLVFYNEAPHILVLEYPFKNIKTSHRLEFISETGTKTLELRGIVYHGQYHFTSRIITAQKQVWYHDGMITGNSCSRDTDLTQLSDHDIRHCKNRNLVLAIYAQSL